MACGHASRDRIPGPSLPGNSRAADRMKSRPPFSAQLAEDEWYFDRFPERHFRLRLAAPTEHPGEVPAAARAYTILSRSGARHTFIGSAAFDPDKSDMQLRQLLGNLSVAHNPSVFSTGS